MINPRATGPPPTVEEEEMFETVEVPELEIPGRKNKVADYINEAMYQVRPNWFDDAIVTLNNAIENNDTDEDLRNSLAGCYYANHNPIGLLHTLGRPEMITEARRIVNGHIGITGDGKMDVIYAAQGAIKSAAIINAESPDKATNLMISVIDYAIKFRDRQLFSKAATGLAKVLSSYNNVNIHLYNWFMRGEPEENADYFIAKAKACMKSTHIERGRECLLNAVYCNGEKMAEGNMLDGIRKLYREGRCSPEEGTIECDPYLVKQLEKLEKLFLRDQDYVERLENCFIRQVAQSTNIARLYGMESRMEAIKTKANDGTDGSIVFFGDWNSYKCALINRLLGVEMLPDYSKNRSGEFLEYKCDVRFHVRHPPSPGGNLFTVIADGNTVDFDEDDIDVARSHVFTLLASAVDFKTIVVIGPFNPAFTVNDLVFACPLGPANRHTKHFKSVIVVNAESQGLKRPISGAELSAANPRIPRICCAFNTKPTDKPLSTMRFFKMENPDYRVMDETSGYVQLLHALALRDTGNLKQCCAALINMRLETRFAAIFNSNARNVLKPENFAPDFFD